MQHARQLRDQRTRRRRGVTLRVIQGRKQIIADQLHTAYVRLGEAVSALRAVTPLHGKDRVHREAFADAGGAVYEAGELLRGLDGDFPGELPALPEGEALAERSSPLPILEKAMALDTIHALLDARERVADVLREAGREAGRPVPVDLPEGPRVERALEDGAGRFALGLVARGSLSLTR